MHYMHTVLPPATVEGVWVEAGNVSSGQLNVTIGWDGRVASYGQLEYFEVQVVFESRVGPEQIDTYQVSYMYCTRASKHLRT